MPKVTRKETAAAPLQEVPSTSGMEVEAGEEQLPPKPSFGALSAKDQAGNKVEFRRVSAARARQEPTMPVAAAPVLARSKAPGAHAATARGSRGCAGHCTPANARFSPPPALAQIPVPQHRMTPLKASWMQLYTPITDHLKLDMRMNLKTKKVEIKTTPATASAIALM